MSSKPIAGAIGTPASEVEIDASLVYSLLATQHPDLVHLPLHLVEAGSVDRKFIPERVSRLL